MTEPGGDGAGAPEQLAAIVAELKALRQRGLLRLGEVSTPTLSALAADRGYAAESPRKSRAVEDLLRDAVQHLGDGEFGLAAQYLFGLVQGTMGRRPTDLREAAARELGGLSVETFRKRHEPRLLARIAEELLTSTPGALGPVPTGTGLQNDIRAAESHQRFGRESASRRYGPYRLRLAAGCSTLVSIEQGPVEELTGVHLVISSENTYLMPARPFSTSLSGSLRRAAEIRGPDGGLVDDVIGRELAEWLVKHARPGGPVDPGVVAVTNPGSLARNGVRAVLHAAVVVPRNPGPGYDVARAAVARAVERCFGIARGYRAEQAEISSMVFPIFGGGNGGLTPEQGVEWLWVPVAKELRLDPAWRIHLATWTPHETVEMLKVIAPVVDPQDA